MTKESSQMEVPTNPIVRRLRGAYLSRVKWAWKHLPTSARHSAFGLTYARYLNRLVREQADRKQYFATFFLRNRPELELLCELAKSKPYGASLKICILACSKGAEVYSIVWGLRSVRPDLQLAVTAVDISQEIVDFASRGAYSFSRADALTPTDEDAALRHSKIGWNTSRDQNAWMFERVSNEELDAIFDIHGDTAMIRPWLQEGIEWMCCDAADSALLQKIGLQDFVIANRFLCHMKPAAAEQCLRRIARLVAPGGHLFVSGIDLDVRTKVALDLHWAPTPELLREIHDGDDSIRRGWPLEYWGLEPLDDRRLDWKVRYASVFQTEIVQPEQEEQEVAACGAR